MMRIEGVAAQAQATAVPRGRKALVVLESAVQFSDTVRQIGSAGWDPIVTSDAERAQWLASIRSFGLVVVCGHSARWLTQVLTALRPVTKAPLLVLSPEAGAWAELAGAAIPCQPFDISDTAAAIASALEMDRDTRAERSRRLQAAATSRTPASWFEDQIRAAD